MKIAVVRANLGGFDKNVADEKQSVACDYITFTDENFPSRDKSMTPRLQAKIPKMFAWQLKPNYDYYLWIDGNLRIKNPDTVKYFLDNCEDIAVLQHPDRNTVWWEYRYNWRALHSNAPSNYMRERYLNELLDEQMMAIKDDKDYKDDLLVNGGIFMYRNTSEVHSMFKEWWYHVSRYLIMDQMSWAYVLKKSGIKYKVLPNNYRDLLEVRRHRRHG